MRRVILDSNLWLYILKGVDLPQLIIDNEEIIIQDSFVLLPAAVKAEILSLAKQREFGEKKLKELNDKFNTCFLIHSNDQILDSYVEIDAFSQGKHPTKKLNESARNMGKNDLWIAATAMATNSILITNDQDFDHLRGIFIDLIRTNL